MTTRDEMLEAKAKAHGIRLMIKEQPPEVLYYLGDSFTLDEEGHFQHEELDECVNEWFEENGYEKPLQKAKIYTWMALPDINITVTKSPVIGGEDNDFEHDWEFV